MRIFLASLLVLTSISSQSFAGQSLSERILAAVEEAKEKLNKVKQPPTSDATPSSVIPVCVSGKVTNVSSTGVQTQYTTIQKAVNAADAGTSIYVGGGTWTEYVLVQNKAALNIQTNCDAIVKGGFRIRKASRILITGFKIQGTNNSPGIKVAGGFYNSDQIEISNNEIYGVGANHNAVAINAKNSNIKILSNYIHDNQRNGLFVARYPNFFDQESDCDDDDENPGPVGALSGGPYIVSQNKITNNKLNGILVNGKPQLLLSSNTIMSNGLGNKPANGYGLKVSQLENAISLQLQNNIIAYNKGKIVKNTASIDIYGFKQTLDPTDSGNMTTAGTEGSGVIKFVPAAPQITSNINNGLYTNISLLPITVTVTTLIPVTTVVKLNGSQVSSSSQNSISLNLTLVNGNNTVSITSVDSLGQTSTIQYSTLVLDNIAPVAQIGINDNVLTNQTYFTIPVHVTDSSPVIVSILQNGFQIGLSNETLHDFHVTLVEGLNKFEIRVIDAAGNNSIPVKLENITLDTQVPILSQLSPTDGSTINSSNISVSGQSNEPLRSVSLNGMDIPLTSSDISFSTLFAVTQDGPVVLTLVATDKAGNQTQTVINTTVQTKVLYGDLIIVEPVANSSQLTIHGLPGAAKPGITVNARAGILFNRGSTTSAANGSFSITLDKFNQAIVSADNPYSGQTEYVTVVNSVTTTLSGIVKDSLTNTPLAGATVKFQEYPNVQTTTSDNGVFTLANLKVTGDQTLVIDGSTIPQPINAASTKQYVTTKVALNIGLGQTNVVPSAIYLTPLILDGTETQIISGGGATVTSPNAPGVSISIPSGTAIFPNGTDAGAISLSIVDGTRTTIPVLNFAKPDTVIALEPSGLKFSQPVDLILPNDNNLPDGVKMIVMSHNSQKGTWEIGASATVKNNQVVTDPGLGINHFSEVYAVPLGPVIRQVNNSEQSGVDNFNGALSTGVTLPSFKSLGQNISPSLSYKSSWAKPTTVVSTQFDIPVQKLDLTADYGTIAGVFYTPTISPTNCPDGLTSCYTNTGYYEYLSLHTSVQTQAWYEPDLITGRFYIGNIQSDQVTSQSPSATVEFKGAPNRSIIAYAIELKDPQTNVALPSGIYASAAKYEIKLRHLTLTTVSTTKVSNLTGTTYSYDTKFESRALEQVFPSDLLVNLYVQNYSNSSAGTGWRINGVQRIVNPAGSRLMLEETDGSVSSYAQANAIQTLFDGTDSTVALEQGVDLSRWPNAIVSSFDGTTTQMAQLNMLSGSVSQNIGALQNYSTEIIYDDSRGGSVNFDPPHNCGIFCYDNGHFGGNFTWLRHHLSAQIKSPTSQVLGLGDGSVVGLDPLNHRFFQINNNGFTQLAGVGRQTVTPGDYGNTLDGAQQYCSNALGIPCTTETQVDSCYANYYREGTNYFASYPYQANCATGSFYQMYFQGASWPGVYTYTTGAPGYNGDGPANQIYLNNPKGITASPAGLVIIADTGNNMIRAYNPADQTITTIAGNGQNYDNGDGGLATDASIYHPQGVIYDQDGNLYITTERGYIRRVNAAGQIETFAGKPVDLGGSIANEGNGLTVALNMPYGMVIDQASNLLYVSDSANHRIVQFDLNTRYMNAIVGTGTCDPVSIDGASALNASLCNPTFLGLDDKKNLIIVDSGHKQIRRVNFNSLTNGVLRFSATKNDSSYITKNTDGTFTRTLRSGLQTYFNIDGRQYASRDRGGRSATMAYDGNGNLSQITDPTGQNTFYQYNGNLLTNITDPAGRITQFQYFGNLLARVIFPDGSAKKYTYDSTGLMISESDERDNTTTFAYNQWNRLATVTRADGSIVQVNDSASSTIGNNYSVQNPGQLQSYGTGQGQVYDGIKDTRQISTKFVKDFRGFVTQVTDGVGSVTSIYRNSFGNPISIARPDGTVVTMTYNNSTQDLLSISDSATGVTQSFTFDNFGNQLTSTDGNGFTTRNIYDANTGYLTSTILPGGRTTLTSYNSVGLPIAIMRTPDDGTTVLTTVYSYDSRGNIASTIDTQGRQTTNTYDIAGNILTSSIKSTGTNIETTAYTYDAINNLISVRTPNGKATTYSYLPGGLLSQIKDPNNKITSMQRDTLGRVTKRTDPLGNVSSFTYDGNGNLIGQQSPNGDVSSFTYDSLNQLIQKTLPDNIYSYTYDIRGNITQAANATSQIVFSVDLAGRVTAIAAKGLGVASNMPQPNLNFAYDNNNNRVMMTDNTGKTINYSYDELNRLKALQNHKGEVFKFNYDNMSRLVSLCRPGSISKFVFDGSSFITSIMHNNTTGNISSLDYSRDGLGNVLSITTSQGVHSFGYDSNSQITSARHPASSGVADENFAYDPVGNRTSDPSGNYSYDATSQRLTQDFKYSYLYDSNGNLLKKYPLNFSDLAYDFSYTSENQLKAINIYNGLAGVAQYGPLIKSITYNYDVLGRRVQKNILDYQNSTNNFTRRYVYDGQEIIFELDGNNQILTRYTQSGLRTDDTLAVDVTSSGVQAGLAQNEGSYFYLKDALGSVLDVTDASGNKLQTYSYSSFGRIASIKDNANNDITNNPILNTSYAFTNREFDQESGMYFFRARYFDTNIGRFIQEDPEIGNKNIPSTLINRYMYAANNPAFFVDPSGRDFGKFLLYLVVGIATFGTGAVVAGIVDGALGFAAGSFGAIATGAIIGAGAGGIVGAILFPAFGLGTAQAGFLFGAGFGLSGGLAVGAGWLGSYSTKPVLTGKDIVGKIGDQAAKLAQSAASPGSESAQFAIPESWGEAWKYSDFMSLLDSVGKIAPYVVGIGGGLAFDAYAYNCTTNSCTIPNLNLNYGKDDYAGK